MQLGRLQEDLTVDRAHDRQDHHRQHDAGGQDGAAGRADRAAEDRQERRVLPEPGVAGDEVGREHEHAPRSVDDARDRRQQVDDVAQRAGQPGRRVVRDEQRDADRERRRDDERDRGRQDRAEQQRRDVGVPGLAVRQLARVGGQRREGLGHEEQRDRRQHDQDEDTGAGREAAEDAVTEPLARAWRALAHRAGARGRGHRRPSVVRGGGRAQVRAPSRGRRPDLGQTGRLTSP